MLRWMNAVGQATLQLPVYPHYGIHFQSEANHSDRSTSEEEMMEGVVFECLKIEKSGNRMRTKLLTVAWRRTVTAQR